MSSIDHSSPNDMDRWMRLAQKVSSSFPGLEIEDAPAGCRRKSILSKTGLFTG